MILTLKTFEPTKSTWFSQNIKSFKILIGQSSGPKSDAFFIPGTRVKGKRLESLIFYLYLLQTMFSGAAAMLKSEETVETFDTENAKDSEIEAVGQDVSSLNIPYAMTKWKDRKDNDCMSLYVLFPSGTATHSAPNAWHGCGEVITMT